jgi:hypothetical protein
MTIRDVLRKFTALIVAILITQIIIVQSERVFYKHHPEIIRK